MLEVQSLSKQYDDKLAVDDVSFTVKKGEVLVLLGTSGCGKTTTLKMINRLVEKSSGKVLIDGKDISNLNPYALRQRIGYIIQETGLFPHMSVKKNMGVVPQLLGWPKSKIENRVKELISLIGLDEELLNKSPDQLSGGQKQRVGIARALAADPPLVLLDEPFGALDPISRKKMQKELLELEGAINKAMVLVTHDVQEAVIVADKICLMHEGRIQQLGKPAELIFKPANKFVEDFFSTARQELELLIFKLKDLCPFLEKGNTNHQIPLTTSISEAAQLESKNVFHVKDNKETYLIKDVLKTYYNNREAIIQSYFE